MAYLIGSQVRQLFSVHPLKKPHLMIAALFSLLLPKKPGNYKSCGMAVKDCCASDRMSETSIEMECSIYSKMCGWGGPEEGTPLGGLFSFSETEPHILWA